MKNIKLHSTRNPTVKTWIVYNIQVHIQQMWISSNSWTLIICSCHRDRYQGTKFHDHPRRKYEHLNCIVTTMNFTTSPHQLMEMQSAKEKKWITVHFEEQIWASQSRNPTKGISPDTLGAYSTNLLNMSITKLVRYS